MFAQMTNSLDFQSKALVLRAERQRLIASNIANADTPGYVARDLDFRASLISAVSESDSNSQRLDLSASRSGNTRHMPLAATSSSAPTLAYAIQSQPAMDGNSVDLDRERANFVDNSVRYEATLRFINGYSKTILSAIQGQ